jgi:CubicO group peptidase (beta-lactamase class C family)
MPISFLRLIVGLLALALALVGVAEAEPVAGGGPKISATAINAPAFTTYVDGVVQGQMQALGAPGVVVAIATPEAVYTQAYGVGERNGQPVRLTVDQQLVPLASVSKAFIAVALMRAVEKGKIDLDAPASRYLDFPIPRFPGAREISVHDLATHSAGFEERWVSTGAGRADETRSFGRLLAETAPNVVAPPGTYQSYSNYGSALLAYVVERAMGKPYYGVLKDEVLDPLGMTSTTIEAPDPAFVAPFAERIVAGWRVSGGVVAPGKRFANVRTYPAGRMLSTPGDMTRFMRMILANGVSTDGQRFLTPASIDALLTPRDRVNPMMTGVGLLFAEKDINGYRFVGHGGDGDTHHVDMVISRELGLAMFVDFLSAPGPQARDYFTRAVLSALTPSRVPEPSQVAAGDMKRYTGTYRHYRWAFTTVEKMLQLTSEFNVKATGKGTLVVTGRLGPGEYAPVDGAGLFRHKVTGELLYLAPGFRGRITLNQGTFPFVTAFKLESWETKSFNTMAYWTFVFGLSALGLFGLVIATRTFAAAAFGPGLGYLALSVALIACGVGFYTFISIAQSLSELDVQGGPPAIAGWLLAIPIASTVLAAAYVLAAIVGVARPRSIGGGLYAFVALAALVVFFVYLSFWNGFGWHMP